MIAFSRRWIRRGVDYVVLPLALAFVVLVLLLRLWILPDIDRWRDDIAASISHSAGQRVTLGEISANWQGLHPRLRIRDIRVLGADGRPVLFLADVRAVLSWTSLLHGELRLASLTMDDVALTIRRDMQGIHVAGILLNQSGSTGGFGDWLLAQRHIQVNHATLAWNDERRGAPYLVARDVNLTLENRGRRHRFRLTAIPPEQLAQPLDIRGDFTGRSLDDLASWHGQIYARVDRTDLGQWRQWLTLPYAISQGYGGLRMWLDVASKQIIAVTVDAALRQVSAQFAPDLPVLRLADISGRALWKRLGPAQSFAVKQLSLRTANFIYVAPFDLALRLDPASATEPGSGRIDANGVQLDRLAALAPYLPLDAAQRQRLTDMQPHGQLEKFTLAWRGNIDQPLDYQVKGSFTRLGWQAQGSLPGAAGLSGNIDATRSSGALALNSSGVVLTLPRVLFEPNLAFSSLTARMNWRATQAGYLIKLTESSFANPDLAGSAFGEYQLQTGRRGVIDLTGRLTRANVASAYHYLPLAVKEPTYQWVRSALLGGQGGEASIRLQGDLSRFPFHKTSDGIFEISTPVSNGVLQYASGWPRIEGIQAQLRFTGTRMEIGSDAATIYGAALRRVSAVIPDLVDPDEILEVKGEATGPLAELVHFANTSPLAAKLDNVTDNLRATGNSRLRLDLKLPLRRAHHATLAGDISFLGNTLVPAHGLPAMDNVQGLLSFTDTGISAQSINAGLLGGAATLSATTQPGGVTRLLVAGRMTAAGLRPYLGAALAGHLSGAADWHARVDLHQMQAQADFESSLVGMASDLPPPFAKAAADSQPLRVKKTLRGADESLLSVHYGQVASALLLQKQKDGEPFIERGALRFGGEAVLPEESGLWITGALPLSDLDRWRSELAAGNGTSGLPSLAGVDLNFSTLDLFGRRFQDININAHNLGGSWRASVAGRGVDGDVTWRPADGQAGQSQGKLGAHFKTLDIPAALPTEGVKPSQSGSLPALDISVDSLQLGNRPLGRLSVSATPLGSGLDFESIHLTNPDSTLTMEGVWNPDRIPQTHAKIHLEVNEVGKFLARFDHPGLVKRGQATLDGEGEWNGTPADIAIPSLSGKFVLKASSGQFAKMDPGIGKLLGVLSLQALPRRIGLDFRDVFSDGFAFDEISGTMSLSRGVVYSDDFRMQGPAAKVSMSGMVDINAETQQLRVAVSPKLSESVALAGTLIGGPIVGLGALAVQKLLKDPFGQAATFEYSVTGAWSDPVVKRIARVTNSSEPQP
ncbi:MAG TPA: YhdP family protein [Sulfuriferula sp.]|nr:YhdP family protein [Sulfuriferula sp.]